MTSKRGGVRKTGNKKQVRTKRSDFEFPYLEPSVCLLTRKDDTEDMASYMNQLNDEEKKWLNQFSKEYVNADTKNAVFHKTAEERKICNDKNNARNRCIHTREVSANRMNLVGSDYEMEQLLYGTENESEESEEEIDLEG